MAFPRAARLDSTELSGYASRSVSAFSALKSSVMRYVGFSGVQSALRTMTGCALKGLRQGMMSPAFSCLSTASLRAAVSSRDRARLGMLGGLALFSSINLVLMLILYPCA